MARVLLLYFMRNSGHHSAARAIEAALQDLDASTRTLCVDPVEHCHPRLAKVISASFVTLMRRTPEVWDSIYDNHRVEGLARLLHDIVQEDKDKDFEDLLLRFLPDAVVCTQAYPFMLMSKIKQRLGLPAPLFGVLTDYCAHCFWANGNGATYIVPNQGAADRLISLGVAPQALRDYGIPVRREFALPGPRAAPQAGPRRVLVMGGSRGIGPKYQTVKWLDRSSADFTMDVVAGSNAILEHRLTSRRNKFVHPLRLRGVARHVADLMRRADLLVSKAGGMTCAEAMCAGLPMLIVHPLPGQEARNTEVLVRQGAALHVKHDRDVGGVAAAVLGSPGILASMRERALAMARPNAASRIAEEVLRVAR